MLEQQTVSPSILQTDGRWI